MIFKIIITRANFYKINYIWKNILSIKIRIKNIYFFQVDDVIHTTCYLARDRMTCFPLLQPPLRFMSTQDLWEIRFHDPIRSHFSNTYFLCRSMGFVPHSISIWFLVLTWLKMVGKHKPKEENHQSQNFTKALISSSNQSILIKR